MIRNKTDFAQKFSLYRNPSHNAKCKRIHLYFMYLDLPDGANTAKIDKEQQKR